MCACESAMQHEDNIITPAPEVTLYKSWAEAFLQDGASAEDSLIWNVLLVQTFNAYVVVF